MEQFRELRKKLKQELDGFIEKEKGKKQAAELEHQQQLRHEEALIDEERNKQLEESKLCDQQRKEEWHKKNWNWNYGRPGRKQNKCKSNLSQ